MQIQEILQRLEIYLARIRKKWLIILLFIIPCTAWMVCESMIKPPLYEAKTVFHPDTGQQVGASRDNPLSLILGTPGEGGETGFMIGVLKSRNISEAVTEDSIVWKGEKRLVADIILDIYPSTPSVTSTILSWIFPYSRSNDKRQKVHSTASAIRSSLYTEATPDGFINMIISFYSPEVAGLISQMYIKKLDEYYKRQKTAKASNSVAFYTQRADSIRRELIKTTTSLAKYMDQHRGLVFSQDRVKPAQLEIRQQILQQMFVTLTISKEQAAAQLQQDTPIIQVLDHPNPPYGSRRPSKILYFFVGLVIGLFLGVVWVIRKLLFEDIVMIVRSQLFPESEEESEEEREEDDFSSVSS